MEYLQHLGYVAALLIGVILGLVGGGGSILTVPVLVYIMGISPVVATGYSLFVVGSSALVGAGKHMIRRQVAFRTAIVFSIPSFIGVYVARKFLVPAIPARLFTIGDIEITRSIGIMLFFAIIMILTSFSMISEKNKEESLKSKEMPYNYLLIILEGALVGVLTGIVGAGGGFLIIPALVLLAKLPIKKAVATSLFIIAVKSLMGFLGDVQNLEIDWRFLLVFTTISISGIFVGMGLNKRIEGKKLRKGFGWFVLFMGIYIAWIELTGY